MNLRALTPVLAAFSLANAAAALTLPAQSDHDTAAIAGVLAGVVAKEAAELGDHRGPFVLTGPTGSSWVPRVRAALRSRHAEVLAVPRPHTLHLSVDDVRITGDSAEAVLSWSLCTTHPAPLNAWQHVITYVFARSTTDWRFLRSDYGQVADGTC